MTSQQWERSQGPDPAGHDLADRDQLPDTVQLQLLSQAIALNPDVPVNYLLRGEEWLVCQQVEQARVDFETAQRLSNELLRQSAWGYIYQAYIDRAEIGLRQCVDASS